jgi:hypothetical protein
MVPAPGNSCDTPHWFNLLKLDLKEDNDDYECEMYKSMVKDVITEISPKMAEITIKSKEFDTKKWKPAVESEAA